MILMLISKKSKSQEGIDIVTITTTIAIIRKTVLISQVRV